MEANKSDSSSNDHKESKSISALLFGEDLVKNALSSASRYTK